MVEHERHATAATVQESKAASRLQALRTPAALALSAAVFGALLSALGLPAVHHPGLCRLCPHLGMGLAGFTILRRSVHLCAADARVACRVA